MNAVRLLIAWRTRSNDVVHREMEIVPLGSRNLNGALFKSGLAAVFVRNRRD